jgi:hypothetical protein
VKKERETKEENFFNIYEAMKNMEVGEDNTNFQLFQQILKVVK